MRPLICNPSPRDIPEFLELTEQLNKDYDILQAKYMPQPQAYNKLREYFLDHKEYDTMILFADDLIINRAGLDTLLEFHKYHPEDVISGICNFDMYRNIHRYCFRVVGDHGRYPNKFFLEEYLNEWKAVPKYAGRYRVEFNGFACCIITRRIIEMIPFRFEIQNGGNVDQFFADDCRANDIDVLVDITVEFQHLAYRTKSNILECSGLGIKEPELVFLERGDSGKKEVYILSKSRTDRSSSSSTCHC